VGEVVQAQLARGPFHVGQVFVQAFVQVQLEQHARAGVVLQQRCPLAAGLQLLAQAGQPGGERAGGGQRLAQGFDLHHAGGDLRLAFGVGGEPLHGAGPSLQGVAAQPTFERALVWRR